MADAHAPLASRLNYARCWEDDGILREALVPCAGKRILSIASAGDNSIALALDGAEVDAIDLSEPQLALTALKLAAAVLDYDDYLALFGLRDRPDPVRLWRTLRGDVEPRWRDYWDANTDLLAQGVLDSGRFEKYLAMFHMRILPLVHRRSTTRRWFDLADAQERRAYWSRWDNVRWQALFRLFFSKQVMSARGRSPEQFAHVSGGIGQALMDRTRRVLTELDPRINPYAQLILTGEIVHGEALPPYLTEQGHAGLHDARERIRLVHAPLGEHLAAVGPDSFDGFNLSDLFEYLDLATVESLFDGILSCSRPGARLAFWNLFVPRHRPARLADRVTRCSALALDLYARDRSFVYGAFHVEEVR